MFLMVLLMWESHKPPDTQLLSVRMHGKWKNNPAGSMMMKGDDQSAPWNSPVLLKTHVLFVVPRWAPAILWQFNNNTPQKRTPKLFKLC